MYIHIIHSLIFIFVYIVLSFYVETHQNLIGSYKMDVTPQTVYIAAAAVSAVSFIYAAWSWYKASKSSAPDAQKAKNPALLVLAVSAAALAFFIWLLMKIQKGNDAGSSSAGLSL
jgi:cytochrome bd-type quinol oxidase subunit 2